MNPFGMYLASLRLQKRLKQKELAEALGVYPSYVSEIESGRKKPPSDKVIRVIAEAMSLKAEELSVLRKYAEQSVKIIHMPDDLPLEGYSCMHEMRRALRTLSADQFRALESMIVVLSKAGGDEKQCKNKA